MYSWVRSHTSEVLFEKRKLGGLGMKWKKFTIKTITDAEDIIISTLYDIGHGGGAD